MYACLSETESCVICEWTTYAMHLTSSAAIHKIFKDHIISLLLKFWKCWFGWVEMEECSMDERSLTFTMPSWEPYVILAGALQETAGCYFLYHWLSGYCWATHNPITHLNRSYGMYIFASSSWNLPCWLQILHDVIGVKCMIKIVNPMWCMGYKFQPKKDDDEFSLMYSRASKRDIHALSELPELYITITCCNLGFRSILPILITWKRWKLCQKMKNMSWKPAVSLTTVSHEATCICRFQVIQYVGPIDQYLLCMWDPWLWWKLSSDITSSNCVSNQSQTSMTNSSQDGFVPGITSSQQCGGQGSSMSKTLLPLRAHLLYQDPMKIQKDSWYKTPSGSSWCHAKLVPLARYFDPYDRSSLWSFRWQDTPALGISRECQEPHQGDSCMILHFLILNDRIQSITWCHLGQFFDKRKSHFFWDVTHKFTLCLKNIPHGLKRYTFVCASLDLK